jgi:hypothetical protein
MLLALVTFGILEVSLFMRDVASASGSTHVGTRIAAVPPGAGPT